MRCNSRQKGARGERLWRDQLRSAFGITDGIHRGQQFSGLGDSPDVVCTATPKIHWEVKLCEVMKIRDWVAQARRDAKAGSLAAVAHKRSREEWLVTIPASHFLELVKRSTFFKPPNLTDGEEFRTNL